MVTQSNQSHDAEARRVPADNERPSAFRRSWAFLKQEVDQRWTDSILILSCFCTGLTDSAINNVYSCFVSMQTGNTVYVGLGVTRQPAYAPYRGIKALAAVLSFCVGTFFFARLSQALGGLRRGTLVVCMLLQVAFIAASAAPIAAGWIPAAAADNKNLDPIVLLPITLLAFQSAGQIVLSRVLEFNEVPTVVLTSTYCDLMLDPHLLTAGLRENDKRNRRLLAIAALVVGAILGGILTKDGSVSLALWVTAGLKAAAALVWLLWKAKGGIRLD